ncbi:MULTISPECIES: phosphatase PAP2 family protein [Aequorivita]|uniref:Phosphatase PAP2 family protein n=1 Tax=Aequorivita iocasae TaxID=2803865 RepID=A0ABX7DT99_9FLAO|nr:MULTISPECIES: phosphatase PAP2 family protein [Aequorivita]QQX76846.1 phosphatase PAP2 family protein [Aequorivita iocasae]UCA56318.1 phosphatase PAP2 family protein [Aequorivita sp. F7]
MIEELLKYDTELFLFLNNLGNTSWDGFWRFVTEKWSSIPIYAILLYLIFKNYGWKGTLVIIVCVALMITATDQIANLFKYGVKRPRPCQVEDLKAIMRFVADGCGRYGYFSAHAASSMAAAVFLGLSLQKWYSYLPFLLLLWAVITGYSRIYLGVHYPLDVISGMAFGGLTGWLFYLLQKWGQKKFNTQKPQ